MCVCGYAETGPPRVLCAKAGTALQEKFITCEVAQSCGFVGMAVLKTSDYNYRQKGMPEVGHEWVSVYFNYPLSGFTQCRHSEDLFNNSRPTQQIWVCMYTKEIIMNPN